MTGPDSPAPLVAAAAGRLRAQLPWPPPDGARLFFAPGRINLLGDHIDYVGGSVLPMALRRGTWVLACPRVDEGVLVHALDAGAAEVFTRAQLMGWSPRGDWRDFVAGALGIDAAAPAASPWPGGLELRVAGDLEGGGLSSSASLTVALCQALAASGFAAPREGLVLARHARRIEHDWVGVACGLMDQAAVVLGREGCALHLDCATEQHACIPLDWGERTLLAIHSGVGRALASSGYNQRREELRRGLHRIGHGEDRIPRLSAAHLMDVADDDVELRRVRHVTHEQRLVEEGIACARGGDWAGFGAAMTASHASLRDDYAVSCPELDRLVDAAASTPGCEGARMTGAGFGGWAIALVHEPAVPWVLEAAAAALGVDPAALRWFPAQPGAGARELPLTALVGDTADD